MVFRIALIGAGTIGKRHIMAIQATSHACLAAISDPAPEVAALARQHGVPLFSEASQMLAHQEYDAVIIATATSRHHEDAMLCLRHHQPLLIEKPIASTLSQAHDIINLAKQNRCPILVGHQRRYYPCAQHAQQLLAQDHLGRLMAVTGQWTIRKDAAYYAEAWRREAEAGPIMINLSHEIDMLRYICGDIESVSAFTTHHDQHFGKEDAVSISLRFSNQALGSFILSDRTPSPWAWELSLGENLALPRSSQNMLRFMGTRAALDFPHLTLWCHEGGHHEGGHHEGGHHEGEKHGREKHQQETGSWRDQIISHPITSPAMPADFDPYKAQIRHLCDIISGEAEPLITAEDATESLKATLAVRASAETAMPIRLKDLPII